MIETQALYFGRKAETDMAGVCNYHHKLRVATER